MFEKIKFLVIVVGIGILLIGCAGSQMVGKGATNINALGLTCNLNAAGDGEICREENLDYWMVVIRRPSGVGPEVVEKQVFNEVAKSVGVFRTQCKSSPVPGDTGGMINNCVVSLGNKPSTILVSFYHSAAFTIYVRSTPNFVTRSNMPTPGVEDKLRELLVRLAKEKSARAE
ncbi:MAG: hypothetical protein ABSB00_01430 [Minisyncoccia bacterium]|jgi:hypothetical protein